METFSSSETWDPRMEAFNNKNFNSYSISLAQHGLPSSAVVQLFVAGIPPCLTEMGLQNLLSSVAQILRVAVIPHKNIGFVSVHQKDAVKVIAYFNNYKLGDSYLTVKYSKSKKPDEKEPRDEMERSKNMTQQSAKNVVTVDDRQLLSTCPPGSKLVEEFKVPKLTYPSIAKYVQVGQELVVEVLNVVSPAQFWVRSVSSNADDKLEELHTRMQQHYFILPPKTGFRPTGSGLYAIPTADRRSWRRVQTLTFDTASVQVLYLDYGTVDRVKLTELHPLEGQFLTLPFQVICCSLHIQGSPQWSTEAAGYMHQLLIHKQVHARVCAMDGWTLHVVLTLPSGANFSDILVCKNYATYANEHEAKLPQAKTELPSDRGLTDCVTVKDLKHMELQVGECYHVVVLDARNADDVTVCLKDSVGELTGLMNDLTTYELSGSYVPGIGEIVVAQYSEDGGWYRAEIVSLIYNSAANVRFIDFGNTAVIKLNSVVPLQKKHGALPVYGISIGFINSSVDSEVLTEFSSLTVTVLEACGNSYIVSLGQDSKMPLETSSNRRVYSLSDLQSSLLDAGRTYKAWVVDAADVSRFYVQVSEIDYQPIEERLRFIYSDNSGGYEPQKVGELVAVHLDVDGAWCRGVVCEMDSKTAIKCQLIDFGIVVGTTIENVGRFHSSLLAYPVVAFRCGFRDTELSAASSWKEDYLLPMTTVYNLTVVDVMREQQLHFVELVHIESKVDWKQRLIDDGVLTKVRSDQVQSVASATNVLYEKDNGHGRNFSADPTSCSSSGKLTEDEPNYHLLESDPPLPSLSDSEVHKLCLNKDRVAIVHARSPSDFYLQSLSGPVQMKLNSLHHAIKKLGRNTSYQDSEFAVGKIVGVLGNDDLWCRALVLGSVSRDDLRVHLVDYGLTKTVPSAEVRQLPASLVASEPRLSLHCAIHRVVGCELGGKWSPAAIAWFQELCENHDFTLKFIFKDDGSSTWMVDLLTATRSRSVREMLIAQHLAVQSKNVTVTKYCRVVPEVTRTTTSSTATHKVDGGFPRDATPQVHASVPTQLVQTCLLPPVNSTSAVNIQSERNKGQIKNLPAAGKCCVQYEESLPLCVGACVCVVHVNSPADFYVLSSDHTALQEMIHLSEKLQEYCSESSTPAYTPQYVGEPVAAMFEGDWFRAEVVDLISNDLSEVHFVDYGNTELVSKGDIQHLPERFVRRPKQAVRCGIDGISGTKEFTEAAVQWFKEFCNHASNARLVSVCIGAGRKHMVNMVVGDGQLPVKDALLASGFAQQD